ncbi:hypothetical protein [Glycomyces sp. NRRL B-16210]|uniref:hypothetical protein n=1 Tax=Glycomyces sp. NRRL B-16210 TaxID=1463821 RepID=UPI00068DA35F|nr:hypothetical protein [Glycomyces sp. NRRL B-16210]
MSTAELLSIAMLLRQRGEIDDRIAEIIGRPLRSGRLAEWIAAVIFDIELDDAAGAARHSGVDGRFRTGPLAGATVNIEHYPRDQGLLNMTDAEELDYYLVMTGPRGPAGNAPPWSIDQVYLFDAQALFDTMREHLRRIGIGTSVRSAYWYAAQIHPLPVNPALVLTADQSAALDVFKSEYSGT